ncbi:hypothetical protein [Streptomyces sp. Ru71]|uniref:hypothetical protein n=1 Tax=Streptomyces sp. Ru71 TaxID=2080746 RepID=UPI0015E2F467|nr:hypothetical protein [Streptomyces sp. Ru71]
MAELIRLRVPGLRLHLIDGVDELLDGERGAVREWLHGLRARTGCGGRSSPV